MAPEKRIDIDTASTITNTDCLEYTSISYIHIQGVPDGVLVASGAASSPRRVNESECLSTGRTNAADATPPRHTEPLVPGELVRLPGCSPTIGCRFCQESVVPTDAFESET